MCFYFILGGDVEMAEMMELALVMVIIVMMVMGGNGFEDSYD